MIISLIAAMAHDRVIGFQGDMPWHLSADLKHFKKITMGKPLIMGRRTFDSIGHALPGRLNIVVTRQADFVAKDCVVVNSLPDALQAAGDVDEVIVMGGGELYRQAFALASRLYLTFIDHKTLGDTFFPEWDETAWQEVSRESHQKDDKNPYDYAFVTLEKLKN